MQSNAKEHPDHHPWAMPRPHHATHGLAWVLGPPQSALAQLAKEFAHQTSVE